MFNWRKPTICFLSWLEGSKRMKYFKKILEYEKMSKEEIEKLQKEKLKNLLLHSYENVPYYSRVLKDVGVVKDGRVYLENFNKIPILTKEIIRKEGDNLYSKDHKKRKSYENTSGGSTGEPVKFLQDREYDDWNVATKMYYFNKYGKQVGEREIKLWGSDRDILEGNLTLKDRVINFVYNRKFFNCYDFSEEKIKELIDLHNSFKPVSYWAYVDGVYEFSKYILENKINLYTPKFIISTIGPLYEENRKVIEGAFGCKVYNQYGSREMGGIGLEGKNRNLDISFWRHLLELDGDSEEKRILITCMDNYSMPLIRYDIGDVATEGNKSYELGGIKIYLTVGQVVGRTLGFFKKRDGSLKHSHFLVQMLFFRDWIEKFQAVQKSFNTILIKVEGKENKEEMKEIEEKIRVLVGEEFNIKWKFVDNIESTKSGKYLYTVCEV